MKKSTLATIFIFVIFALVFASALYMKTLAKPISASEEIDKIKKEVEALRAEISILKERQINSNIQQANIQTSENNSKPETSVTELNKKIELICRSAFTSKVLGASACPSSNLLSRGSLESRIQKLENSK